MEGVWHLDDAVAAVRGSAGTDSTRNLLEDEASRVRPVSTLAFAAALSLAACGQDAPPLSPLFRTAAATCTKTTDGALADCQLLESSDPGIGAWVLDHLLREQRFDPTLDEGVPVEAEMVFRFVMSPRWEAPPAP